MEVRAGKIIEQNEDIFSRPKTHSNNTKHYPGKRPQTVWGSGRIMHDNVDDDDYDDDYDDDDDDDDNDDDDEDVDVDED